MKSVAENDAVDLGELDGLLSGIDMGWTEPVYSRKKVNQAGRILVEGPSFLKDSEHILEGYEDILDETIDIVANFRAAHAFPLNTIQIGLRQKAKAVDQQSIVAQRLKRLSSIHAKLTRFHSMELWDMQDIGGCRAIVQTVNDVNHLVGMFKESRMRHTLTHEDDYIQRPRNSAD